VFDGNGVRRKTVSNSRTLRAYKSSHGRACLRLGMALDQSENLQKAPCPSQQICSAFHELR